MSTSSKKLAIKKKYTYMTSMSDFHFPSIPPIDPSREAGPKQSSQAFVYSKDLNVLICLLLFQKLYKLFQIFEF